ncbi:MAG: hypothetical protein ACKOSO_07145 [Actinomycetota bacterium]
MGETSEMLPIWIGLGVFMALPFLALGAFIKQVWFPVGFAIVGAGIWIYGLGLGGYLAAAIGGVAGALLGHLIYRRRAARGTVFRHHPDPKPGDPR